MNDTASALSTYTYTKPDLDRRVGLLRASLEEVLYNQDESAVQKDFKEAVLDVARAEGGSEEDLQALAAWYQNLWAEAEHAGLPQFLKHLEEASHALPVFELYVPVALCGEALAELCTWYRKELVPNGIFVLHVDPALVGGCGFVSRDTYHEQSLHTALEQHPGLITKLIASYG